MPDWLQPHASRGWLCGTWPAAWAACDDSCCRTAHAPTGYTSLVLNEMDGLTLQGRIRAVTLRGAPPLTNALHADWGLGGTLGMLAGITGSLALAAFLILCVRARMNRL